MFCFVQINRSLWLQGTSGQTLALRGQVPVCMYGTSRMHCVPHKGRLKTFSRVERKSCAVISLSVWIHV